ncbi:MAG: helix-turn-helix domain-containing protein [Chitinophagales bacterium]|nr:helix-turn-helix domain-containing protein [Chitinophagales bacterium]
MKENNISNETIFRQNSPLVIVPEDLLESILNKQDKILELLESKNLPTLKGYVTEKQAMEILDKKVTWFWQVRKSGKLPFKKIGKTVYYAMEDIYSLLENSI